MECIQVETIIENAVRLQQKATFNVICRDDDEDDDDGEYAKTAPRSHGAKTLERSFTPRNMYVCSYIFDRDCNTVTQLRYILTWYIQLLYRGIKTAGYSRNVLYHMISILTIIQRNRKRDNYSYG